MSISQDFYQQWRSSVIASMQLKESATGMFPEKILHMVWMYQRFNKEKCSTTTGHSLKILHPGFWNYGPGPDFRSAVISINGEEMAQADVEIDVKASYWLSHRHDLNPAFNKVRLHVIWKGPVPENHPIPVFELSKYVQENEIRLKEWANERPSEIWPELIQGKCSTPLSNLGTDSLQILTSQASLIRLRIKTRQIEEDARRVGFEDALWLHLVAGLGYRNNQWPMRQMGEMKNMFKEGLGKLSYSNALMTLQARLLGVSNLLPKEIPASQDRNQAYLEELWAIWWRERDKFEPYILPLCIWNMQGIRPANHPTRRLATVAHWMLNKRMIKQMENWFNTPKQPRDAMQEMADILGNYSDEFWSWHWSLKGDAMKRPAPLMGGQRTSDLVINTILPWLLARTHHSGQKDLMKRVERLYLGWPRLADNQLLKLARRRLMKGQACQWIKSAAHQQGLLQIIRDFCNHSNATCEQCLFPELARSLEINQST
jgi:hypothetical protein